MSELEAILASLPDQQLIRLAAIHKLKFDPASDKSILIQITLERQANQQEMEYNLHLLKKEGYVSADQLVSIYDKISVTLLC